MWMQKGTAQLLGSQNMIIQHQFQLIFHQN